MSSRQRDLQVPTRDLALQFATHGPLIFHGPCDLGEKPYFSSFKNINPLILLGFRLWLWIVLFYLLTPSGADPPVGGTDPHVGGTDLHVGGNGPARRRA